MKFFRPEPQPPNVQELLKFQTSGPRDLIGEAVDSGKLVAAEALIAVGKLLKQDPHAEFRYEAVRALGNLMRSHSECVEPGLRMASEALLKVSEPKLIGGLVLLIKRYPQGVEIMRSLALDLACRVNVTNHLFKGIGRLGQKGIPLLFDIARIHPRLGYHDVDVAARIARKHARASLRHLLGQMDHSCPLLNECCGILANDHRFATPVIKSLFAKASDNCSLRAHNAIQTLGFINRSPAAASKLRDLAAQTIERIEAKYPAKKEQTEAPKSGWRWWMRSQPATSVKIELPPELPILEETMNSLARLSREQPCTPSQWWVQHKRSDKMFSIIQNADPLLGVKALDLFFRHSGEGDRKCSGSNSVSEVWNNALQTPGGDMLLLGLLDAYESESVTVRTKYEILQAVSRSLMMSEVHDGPPLFQAETLREIQARLPHLLLIDYPGEKLLITRLSASDLVRGHDQAMFNLALKAFDMRGDEWLTRGALKVMLKRGSASEHHHRRLEQVIDPSANYDWHCVEDALQSINRISTDATAESWIGKVKFLYESARNDGVKQAAAKGLRMLDPLLTSLFH